MVNCDDYTNENKTKYNLKWPYFSDHPYRILVIGGCGSGKINALLNLIHNQPDIDKIYLCPKDPYEAKYQYVINKHEKVGLDTLMILKFLLNTQMKCKMFVKVAECYLGKKRKVLIVFDDIIIDMINSQ